MDDGCDGRLKAYYNMNGFLTSFIDKVCMYAPVCEV